MTQPPSRDHDQGAEPGRGDGLRDPRLAGFARGGEWDRRAPGPELVSVLAEAGGPEWSCPGAEPDELVGVLRRLAAAESWTAAAKLGVIREMIRQDDLPLPGRPRRGALPRQWSESLVHELALALATSAQSADKLMQTACELGSRLPGTGRLLASGILTLGKAGLIAETFQELSDADAARAEELLLPQLAGPTGKTFGQLERLAAAVAAGVDPGSAERQRKAAERERSRVQLFRERSGTAALSGRDLPADETLAAYANVNARTGEYKESGAFPGARLDQLRATAYLDLLNGVTADARIAHATAEAEAQAESGTGTGPAGQAGPGGWPGPGGGPCDCSCGECDGGCTDPGDDGPDDGNDPGDGPGDDSPSSNGPGTDGPGGDSPDSGDPGDAGPGDSAPGDSAPGDSAPGDSAPGDNDPGDNDPGDGPGDAGTDDAGSGHADLSGTGPDDDGEESADAGPGDDGTSGGGPGGQHGEHDPGQDEVQVQDPGQDLDPELVVRPAVADLVIPLLTLLGLAERPGEGHGLGPLDPGLCRDLAATAASWPGSQWCLTITDQDGIAIGHGCAKPARPARAGRAAPASRGKPVTSLAALPARVNLTIPLPALESLRGLARPPAPWAFMPRGDPGPDNPDNPDRGYGTWTLVLPGGRDLMVTLGPVPVYSCDHRHESRAYKPNGTLRHLVQVRDWECTFPSCSRHARASDFEHAVPYGKGGRTCACNAGARSRKCHRIKQSPGWNVTQPRPGWHQWTTPAGRIYTQGPKRYPA